MEFKSLMACVYLKHGKAFTAIENSEPIAPANISDISTLYNDCGIDKLIVLDLADSTSEHDVHMSMLKVICENSEIPVVAGGFIKDANDAKQVLYAGAMQVILNGSKPDISKIIKEAGERFGKEKIAITLSNVDILFKHREIVEENVSYIIVFDEKLIKAIEDLIALPLVPVINDITIDSASDLLSMDNIIGISAAMLQSYPEDVMSFKSDLVAKRISMKTFRPSFEWTELKTNSDGLIPAIVQDYQTGEVLMLAYMNEESYMTTMKLGKMTYWSRSRQELWIKGDTSGHYQYVKAIYTDCDCDTILAKVSQVGAACHTGARSCFFNEILKKQYNPKNPLTVFEDLSEIINNRKENPVEGSYTNYLFDKGLDTILQKIGEETVQILLAAKSEEKTSLRYEISDLMFHLMILMNEKDITWLDIAKELAQRE